MSQFPTETAKMGFKVLFALTAVVCIAVASDRDIALWIAHCARNATAYGAPEAMVPSHSPAFMHLVNWNITLPLGLIVVHSSIINPNFHGVPDVYINGSQLSKDDDAVAKFQYELYWPKYLAKGQYEFEVKGLINKSFKGNWELLFDSVYWTGQIHFNKAKHHFDKLTVNWKNKDIKVHINGAGAKGDILAALMEAGLKTAFATGVTNLAVDVLLGFRLNEVWLKNATRVDALLDFCRHLQ